MVLKELAALLVVLVIVAALPLAMIWSFVDHVRHGQRRARSRSSAAVGSAMLDLDRLVARPSVEHVIEAQAPVVRHEDAEDPPTPGTS